MKTIIIVLALLVAVGRMFITPRLNIPPFNSELSYEAFAHIVWGTLFGMWVVRRGGRRSVCEFCGWLAIFLALWELGWFLCQKYL